MAISSVSNQEVTKPLKKQEEETTAVAVPEGDHAKKDKTQNTDVFYNHLDNTQQQIIKEAIGGKDGAINKWASPDKIAKSLKEAGYDAKVGKEGNTTYLEVTGKDGQKYKIWDVGGDSGIGSQDIQFNGQLDNFKNDVAALKNKDNADKVGKNNQIDPFNFNAYKNYLDYLIRNLKDNAAALDIKDENQKAQREYIELFEILPLQKEYDSLK